ncbi:MAG: hypothetical protein ACRCXC_09325 [Legionella sp.]
MKEKFSSYKKVNIGLSYNQKNDGAAANAIKQIIAEQGLKQMDIDYRAIVGSTPIKGAL